VQVIKPPVLLELSGPLFMSYPAINHIELRLEQIAGAPMSRCGTVRLARSTRRIGGVSKGWKHYLDSINKMFPSGAAGLQA